MSGGATTYNERSWAIDLIGHLKQLAGQSNQSIRDAGGEQTINAEGGSLFPDVLLFGDRATTRILQGWELKMPDTGIDDFEFRENAEIKARALGLDSFLLWNVSYARLYVYDVATDAFLQHQEWINLADIRTRTAVVANRRRWEILAGEIFSYLNDMFDRGSLQGRQFIDAYRSGGVTSLIMENAGQVADALTNAARRNGVLRAEMTLWWDRYRTEYAGGTMEQVLAQAVISNWIGKILFGHILREQAKAERMEEERRQAKVKAAAKAQREREAHEREQSKHIRLLAETLAYLIPRHGEKGTLGLRFTRLIFTDRTNLDLSLPEFRALCEASFLTITGRSSAAQNIHLDDWALAFAGLKKEAA